MSLPATTLLRLFGKGAVTMCCIAAATSALAKESDVKFAGFASLAYAKTITSDKEGPLNGVGNEGEYRDFNTVGFRMDADLKDNVAFTAQLVAYGVDNYDPTFDWIFVNVGITPELRLEVGKTRIPLYMYSDFIDVGYSYQWIEPPSSIYISNIMRTLEGLKLVYTTNMGDWTSELMVFGGTDEEHVKVDKSTVDIYQRDASGLAWTVDYEWLSLRAVYMQATLSLENLPAIDQLSQGIAGTGAGINGLINSGVLDQTGLALISTDAIEKALGYDNDKLEFYGIGSALDFGSTFAIFELKQATFADNITSNDNPGGYLTLGVRLPEKVTLSMNYGQTTMRANPKILETYNAFQKQLATYPVLTTSDPNAQQQVDDVNAAINTLINGDLPSIPPMGFLLKNIVEVAQHKTIDEYGLQLRWDFHPSAAFKFEYLLQDRHQFSSQTFKPEHVQPQAYMVGIDLVF